MTKDHFKEPLPPGVKNLDNYEIDFPEHNLEDYVCYSNKDAKDPYKEFQEWLNKCPVKIKNYLDYTDEFEVTFSLKEPASITDPILGEIK